MAREEDSLMHSRKVRTAVFFKVLRELTAVVCMAILMPGNATELAQGQQAPAPTQDTAAKISPDQLDSLVAPIALYPDPMLSQTLVASTYPLEIVQLKQWLDQHKDLKDKALADAVAKQDWDPSIQALAGLPEVVKLLSENVKWTTDLGNAFLAQQSDVMDAVQRMRKKAKDSGNLKNSEQQKVETKTVENKQVIVVEQANPQVVYVPSYNPTVVYGAPPAYAYPPIAYPPPGYYAAGMAISFGVGVAMGAMWGGGWGYHCGWGGNNNITINNNNNFVRNTNTNVNRNNIQGGNRTSTRPSGGNTWQHNPQHRGGAPYSDRTTANKYDGTARGDSMQQRQANARQNQTRQNQGRQQAGTRGGASAGSMDRSTTRNASAKDHGGPSAASLDRSSSRGGGERVGNQSVPRNTPSSTNRSAFGGAGSGTSGSQARASSSRGSASYGRFTGRRRR